MKVVLSGIRVHPFHKYGGAEIYIFNLAKYLVKNGIEVKVFTSTPKEAKNATYEGVKFEFVRPHVSVNSSIGIFSYHLFNINLSKKLEKEEFDLLHSFGMTVHNYLRRHKNKVSVVVEPFGLYGSSEEKIGILRSLARKILIENPLKYCVKHASAIAVEGKIQAEDISKKFDVPDWKFIYIPDGIELDVIDGYLCKSTLTREKLGLGDADVVLVNVNRLVKNKGVTYLIDALKILNDELNVKLILIGAGPEEEPLKQKISKLGLRDKVLHFKNIPDEKKFQLISLADISVTPTLFEGLPIVILEAMACGKPVVASNVTEVPQVVKHGMNGYLVPPRNPEAIARAVLEIHDKGLMERMGKESRKIAENYDWGIIVKSAIKEYEKIT
ncbi:MAG: glycosyltransferase family 4 protein [Candidatus Bathyarchaeia archaeon]